MAYKTPGVYVEEISLFPPSVAQVETAIPAFIGYTEKAVDENGKDIIEFPYIRRIKSLLEYQNYFGLPQAQQMRVTITKDMPDKVTVSDAASALAISKYRMHYALQLFFANGGGPCYIICVSKYTSPESVDKSKLINDGLAALKKLDEPTLIVFPGAAGIDGDAQAEDNYYEVLAQALIQCNELGDRFLICDLFNGSSLAESDIEKFRTGIGNDNLKYGSAYHPWLNTTIVYRQHGGSVFFESTGSSNTNNSLHQQKLEDVRAILIASNQKNLAEVANADTQAATTLPEAKAFAIKAANAAIKGAQSVFDAAFLSGRGTTEAKNNLDLANTALANAKSASTSDLAKTAAANAFQAADAALTMVQGYVDGSAGTSIEATDLAKIFSNEFESNLKALLEKQKVTLPPSGAVAGVYAQIDSTRGVWKAPANVSLNAVIEPAAKISNSEQDGMNIHPTGKSINAIRAFTGKGVMVWGARTLDGNSNEWRYVSTRRFFNMAEESIKKATEQFVFEPNDANTWVKVRAMIENYLTTLWRQGALAGAKPEEAFFVKVGLGQTMTALDILEGRMIVEIGMAAVRPAEFIILKFTHKMQES